MFWYVDVERQEVFDRLYEDWSTLEKFQRTRGVLQYMAIVIHRLWNSDNKDALIMPGSLPLEDGSVLNKSIHYLPQGWEPVIEREVDGPQSEPYRIDGHTPRFGSVQAARRTTRTLFLGSAPSMQEQTIRGIGMERILLGAVQPGQAIGVFEDVLRSLRDRLHYLYSAKDRYWLDTRPNLRREMESRKQNINEHNELLPLLKTRVTRAFGRGHQLGGVHVFTPSVDVPDDYGKGPRLVVLPTNKAYSRSETNQAFTAAQDILRNRGDQPRQRQNRLIFLAPDYDVVSRLKEQGRIFLAWQSIVADIESGALNQDLSHLKQAKMNRDGADQSLSQLVRETWKWLIHEWSPIHLCNMLKQWYLKDGAQDISAVKVWQDSCHYLYLPRLLNDHVFRNAINRGLENEGYFAFAAGKEGDRYFGFAFGNGSVSALDESSLLIDREAAVTYRERIRQAPRPGTGSSGASSEPADITASDAETGDTGALASTPEVAEGAGATSLGATKKQFYGAISLDPVKAKMDFATVMDEVVQQFTTRLGVDVTISVEIEANSNAGFDEGLERTVKENCNVLRFRNAEFE